MLNFKFNLVYSFQFQSGTEYLCVLHENPIAYLIIYRLFHDFYYIYVYTDSDTDTSHKNNCRAKSSHT